MNTPNKNPSFVDTIEETLIALILGLMVIITFANVVVRYVFNASWFSAITETLSLPTNMLWSVEVTSILFAWLILLGISYCVKITAHLGVDAIVTLLTKPAKRVLTLIACAVCLLYSFLLLKGGWDFFANFANLPQTTGRAFPTGFEKDFLAKGWYETDDVVMPEMLQFLADWFNDGEKYEKVPRLVPYIMLPIGMGLLFFRFCQLTWRIWTGKQEMIIVSHEAEEAVEEAAAKVAAVEKGA